MDSVTGSARSWLRVEALVVLLAALFFYHAGRASWLLFAALFFAPDLSMLGYLAGSRAGAAVYNAAHAYVLPLALLGAGAFLPSHVVLACGLIWAAHIGLDRMLGYGLKYPAAFQQTHLGKIGN